MTMSKETTRQSTTFLKEMGMQGFAEISRFYPDHLMTALEGLVDIRGEHNITELLTLLNDHPRACVMTYTPTHDSIFNNVANGVILRKILMANQNADSVLKGFSFPATASLSTGGKGGEIAYFSNIFEALYKQYGIDVFRIHRRDDIKGLPKDIWREKLEETRNTGSEILKRIGEGYALHFHPTGGTKNNIYLDRHYGQDAYSQYAIQNNRPFIAIPIGDFGGELITPNQHQNPDAPQIRQEALMMLGLGLAGYQTRPIVDAFVGKPIVLTSENYMNQLVKNGKLNNAAFNEVLQTHAMKEAEKYRSTNSYAYIREGGQPLTATQNARLMLEKMGFHLPGSDVDVQRLFEEIAI